MSATEPEARAALIFSSLEASGTHWNSKSIPVCSRSASMIGPSAAGVVGVCNMDIQVRAFALPPAESPPPPQAARAVAPRAAAGRDFRRDRRRNMTGFLSGAARARSEPGLVAAAALRRRAVRHRTGRGQVLWI